MSQDLTRCGDTSLLVYLLVILFGISSWVDINGLWVELPILVQNLPEGWDLPSYMAVIIQVANVAPLAYTVASTVCPQRTIEKPVIYLIIFTGAVACLLLAFLWDRTSTIAGTEHSTALFVLQFFLALVDCTSSVAFLPFMSLFKPRYMTAYFIGEGFSGLIPSLVALGQGAGSMKCVNVSFSDSDSDPNATGVSIFSYDNNNNNNVTSFFNNEDDVRSIGNGSSTLSASATTIGFLLSNFTEEVSSFYDMASPSPTSSSGSPGGSFSVFPQYQPPKFTVQVFFFILMFLLLVSALSFTLLNYWSYCKMQHVSSNGASQDNPIADSDWDADTSTSTTPINSTSSDIDVMANSKTVSKYKTSVIYNDPEAIRKPQPLSLHTQTINSANCKAKIAFCSRNNSSCDHKSDFRILSKYSVSGASSSSGSSDSDSDSNTNSKKSSLRMSKPKYVLFMVLTAWLCALSNGVLPSIQTYSCLPYGIQSYHLAVTLSSIANPVACFATFFLQMMSSTATVVTSLLGTGLSAFILLTAATSPEPPLVDHFMGAFVIILCWVLAVFVLTYTKVTIATLCRHQGRRALLWVGANTQLGSLIGAIVTFLLVNYFKLFKVANPCA